MKAFSHNLILPFLLFSQLSVADNILNMEGSGNKIDAINIGDKIANISNMNGNIEINNINNTMESHILDKINYMNFKENKGFSVIYYNSDENIYYINEHAHAQPILKKVKIETNSNNYININELNGSINNHHTTNVDGDYVNGNKTIHNGGTSIVYDVFYDFSQNNNETYSLDLNIKR